MSVGLEAGRDRLWVYMVLPTVILNLAGCLIFGTYYGLAAEKQELVSGIVPGQLNFLLYMVVLVVEWAFAFSLLFKLRRAGASIRDLIAPSGAPWRFRWLPALLVFVAFNGIFAVYIGAWWFRGLRPYEGLMTWQRVLIIALIPLSAAFCEELIWRGYIITRLEARGTKAWSAILISATSWALIHGIFLPDRVAVTFLIGVVTGFYFVRERNLVPLMVTHAVVNLWSFGLLLFL
jgi:membrane protease YdiL (CAAX protease family)